MASNRAGVRAAVAAWFQPPAVTGLSRVYTSLPKNILPKEYISGMPAGTKSGAVGAVHILTSKRNRRAFGGAHAGWKEITYEVELQLQMRSTQKRAEDAMADFDTLVDAVITRLESDRTLGSPDVFQAGEAMLETENADPRIDLSVTWLWSALKFEVVQMVPT